MVFDSELISSHTCLNSPQIPSFKLPFPPGMGVSVSGPPHKKARRFLRAGAGASVLDRVLKVNTYNSLVVLFIFIYGDDTTQSLARYDKTRHDMHRGP